MTTRILLTVATATLVVASADGRDRKYQTVTVGGWAVTLPADRLRTETDKKAVEFGPKPGQTVAIETDFWEVRDVVYTLTVARLPAAFDEVPEAVLLDGAAAGLVGSPTQGATVVAEEAKEVRGTHRMVACKAVKLKAGGRAVRARLVAADGRLCQLTAVGSLKAVEAAEVTAALDTFTALTPDP